MSQRMPDYEALRESQARAQESIVTAPDDESICGETFDHAQRITFEDVEVEQWECTRCGAEWYHDKEGEE